MNPERIRAAIRLLYPDEMTPTAKRVLERILDEYEAPVSAGASLCQEEDAMSEQCANTEHIDCDGTTKAPMPEWGWDPCTCNCHPKESK